MENAIVSSPEINHEISIVSSVPRTLQETALTMLLE